MSEQNKALVREVLDRAWSGDLSVLEEHPGMHEIIPFMTAASQMAEVHSRTIHEQLADGEWVITRSITESTINQDVMGVAAGTRITTEAISMHRVVDGVIVKQHTQGGRIDVPNPWD